jgi:hypothetical protein
MDGGMETRSDRPERAARALALGQGLFYTATGVWPLLSRRSFESVTGPKTDWWLVQTVGLLVTAIGGTLTIAGAAGRAGSDLRRLAVASALGLAAIDIVHSTRGRISKVYLLDAAGELCLAAAWVAFTRRGHAGGVLEDKGAVPESALPEDLGGPN